MAGAYASQQQTAQIRRTPLLMLLVVLAVQLLVYVETYGNVVAKPGGAPRLSRTDFDSTHQSFI